MEQNNQVNEEFIKYRNESARWYQMFWDKVNTIVATKDVEISVLRKEIEEFKRNSANYETAKLRQEIQVKKLEETLEATKAEVRELQQKLEQSEHECNNVTVAFEQAKIMYAEKIARLKASLDESARAREDAVAAAKASLKEEMEEAFAIQFEEAENQLRSEITRLSAELKNTEEVAQSERRKLEERCNELQAQLEEEKRRPVIHFTPQKHLWKTPTRPTKADKETVKEGEKFMKGSGRKYGMNHARQKWSPKASGNKVPPLSFEEKSTNSIGSENQGSPMMKKKVQVLQPSDPDADV